MDAYLKMNKWLLCLSIIGFSAGQSGCSRDAGVSPIVTSPDSLFWSLRISYPAVRLTSAPPYNTLQLDALPYNVLGSQIEVDSSEARHVRWISSDSTLVRVSENGMITARGVTGTKKVYITAIAKIGKITKEDRSLVQVVDNSNISEPVSLLARTADSLKRAVGTNFILIPKVTDRSGGPVTGLPIHYRSSNPVVGRQTDAWSGTIFAGTGFTGYSNSVGKSHITVSTWAYGVALIDTFTIEVGYPIDNPLFIPMADNKSIKGIPTTYLLYPMVDVGPGGVVSFANGTAVNGVKAAAHPGLQPSNGIPISFIFEDSLNVISAGPSYSPTADGNIHDIVADTLIPFRTLRQFRKFREPGEYKYTIEPLGLKGVVIVHDK